MSNRDIIPHKDALNMLELSMLVYNYGKDFSLKKNEDIDSLITDIKTSDLGDMGETRKKALISLSNDCPHGNVIAFIDNSNSDLQCVITKSETKKRISIVFRGSESISDWYYDLSFFKTYLEKQKVYVHSGFYKQLTYGHEFTKIKNTVKTELIKHPDYELYVTGHSLGGALCTLCGFLLSYEIKSKIHVVSFASPRVGDSKWKKVFDSRANLRHHRITNRRDIVTAAPMAWFKHVGDNIRVKEDCYKWFPNYSYSWWDVSLFKCYSIQDHDCDLYYERLLKNQW
jgi:predicted lipase